MIRQIKITEKISLHLQKKLNLLEQSLLIIQNEK